MQIALLLYKTAFAFKTEPRQIFVHQIHCKIIVGTGVVFNFMKLQKQGNLVTLLVHYKVGIYI